jgi:hypothetical protein
MSMEKLRKAMEERDIGLVISMAPGLESPEAEGLLDAFYEREMQIANAVLNLEFFSKVYREKVRPPLKGCYSVEMNEHITHV